MSVQVLVLKWAYERLPKPAGGANGRNMRCVVFQVFSSFYKVFASVFPSLMSAGVALGTKTCHKPRGVTFQVFPSLYRILGIHVLPLHI